MGQGGGESQNEQSAVAKGKGALAINAASYANVTVYQYVTYEGGNATTRETTDPSVCPYPGLETFRTSEAEFFSGREGDVRSLEAELAKHDVCGVIAASGAGKSSLVHAGLIPALAAREAEAWDVFAFKPGQEPLHGLARSMSGVLAGADSRKGQYKEIDDTVADLRETPGRLKRYIEDIASCRQDTSDGKRHNVLIFIDQWEELYTRENEDDHNILVRELLDVAERGLAKVLLTMRIDFMEEMVSISTDLFRRLARHFVEPMDEIGLRSVIEHPAKVKGLGVPEALTSRLIADLRNGKDHGSLPYLQFVLHQLWEKRDKATNGLTTEAYDGMKGLKGTIGAHADAVFGKLSVEEQQLAQRILPRLANVSETGATTSRRLPFADFDEPARQLLRKLAEPDRRLIVLSSATADVQEAEIVAEVAHEALLDDWKTLASWIADRKEFFRLRNKLEADAKSWVENGRSKDFLIPRGKPLLDAEDLLSNAQDGEVSKDLEDCIAETVKKNKVDDEAKQRVEKEQLNRLTTRNRGLMVLSAVFIAATLGAGYFWNQSLKAQEEALTLADQVTIESTPSLAASGETDLSLLRLISSSERFVERDDISDSISIAIEATLRENASRSIFEVPVDSTGYEFRDEFYLHSPTEQIMHRVSDAGEMVELGRLPGSLMGIFDLRDAQGAINATVGTLTDSSLKFFEFNPIDGIGEEISTFDVSQAQQLSNSLFVNPDGMGFLRQTSLDFESIGTLFSLTSGVAQQVEVSLNPLVVDEYGESHLEEAFFPLSSNFDLSTIDFYLSRFTYCSFDNTGNGLWDLSGDEIGTFSGLLDYLNSGDILPTSDPEQRMCYFSGSFVFFSSSMNTSAGPIETMQLWDLKMVSDAEQPQLRPTLIREQGASLGFDFIADHSHFTLLQRNSRSVQFNYSSGFGANEEEVFNFNTEISATGLVSMNKAAVLLEADMVRGRRELVIVDRQSNGSFSQPLNPSDLGSGLITRI